MEAVSSSSGLVTDGRCYGITCPGVKHSVTSLRFRCRAAAAGQGQDLDHSYADVGRHGQHVAESDLLMSPVDAPAVDTHVTGFDHPLGGGAGSREAQEPEQLVRSEEHTSELKSLMRISYAVFCLKKNNK